MRLFRSFDPAAPEGAEVPDPYYGEREGSRGAGDGRGRLKGLAEHLAVTTQVRSFLFSRGGFTRATAFTK
ncbi:hypothetical protein [Streptosporangium vulgare]|uniref:hypothetical protein n=1 Tax=Streptosporangium vulgare TaxID=46190 RepID=UPI0031D9EC5F